MQICISLFYNKRKTKKPGEGDLKRKCKNTIFGVELDAPGEEGRRNCFLDSSFFLVNWNGISLFRGEGRERVRRDSNLYWIGGGGGVCSRAVYGQPSDLRSNDLDLIYHFANQWSGCKVAEMRSEPSDLRSDDRPCTSQCTAAPLFIAH